MGDDTWAGAVQAVLAEMAGRSWTTMDLSRAAGIDPGTAGDFLAGKRQPKIGTLGKIDKALGWDAGELARITREGGAPKKATVGAEPHNEDVLLHLPAAALDGLSDMEREEVIARARAVALQAAREIRETKGG